MTLRQSRTLNRIRCAVIELRFLQRSENFEVQLLCLTLRPWSGTFKFQHTIYVKFEYFMNLENGNIVKYMTFCGRIDGDGAS